MRKQTEQKYYIHGNLQRVKLGTEYTDDGRQDRQGLRELVGLFRRRPHRPAEARGPHPAAGRLRGRPGQSLTG